LGFLNAEYSLHRVDAMAADRRLLILVTVLISLILGLGALWLMFPPLLGRPIRRLIEGTEQIAAGRFDFRFERPRNDEIGLLQESFNTMVARIQAHREELRSVMEYLNGIVENSADIIITVSPEGYIETLNRGAEQALGYRRVEVIGKRIEMLFADPRERDVAIAQLKRTGRNVTNYHTHFRTKHGQVRDVLLTLSYLRDRHGNPIGTFGISKDITREKKLQQELLQSQRFAAIGQAVTGIQHAIKNLLNGLKGGAFLIRVGLTKDNRQRIEEGLAMVEESIERISQLSRNMLNYAKEWKLELQTVDLGQLLEKISSLNQPAAADRGVTLRNETSPSMPPIRCDPELIGMATTDLVVNAIDACTWKHYPPGQSPEVVVRAYPDDASRRVVIEVRDNGCGMDEEIKWNIFTPFFSTKKTLGSGLGLALTARIINVHGGQLSVESEPDQGSVFRIQLPVDVPRNKGEC